MRVHRPQLMVAGVGGAGVNAVSRLIDVGLSDVHFLAADTSVQTLSRAPGATQLSLTAGTRGLGTGGDSRLGAAAALGAERELRSALAGHDLVFVVAGLAGGTGGGAGPEVARIAGSMGAVPVGFAIMPFAFEARCRARAAERTAAEFRDACDTTVVLENDRALAVAGSDVSLDVALRIADDALRQAVQGLSELVSNCGWINLDLATVRGLLAGGGEGCLALGVGRGAAPARAAMQAALASPLVDMGALRRAGTVLVQVSGGMDLSVSDTAAAVAVLKELVAAECELVVGSGLDPTLLGAAQVTVLGTGLHARSVRPPVQWPLDRGVGLGRLDANGNRAAILPLSTVREAAVRRVV